jgi:hypothetical protein
MLSLIGEKIIETIFHFVMVFIELMVVAAIVIFFLRLFA